MKILAAQHLERLGSRELKFLVTSITLIFVDSRNIYRHSCGFHTDIDHVMATFCAALSILRFIHNYQDFYSENNHNVCIDSL